MLGLFDMDGTLLSGSDVLHFAAMRAALGDVFGRGIGEQDGVPKAGRTDIAIARDVAAAHGVARAEFDGARDAVASRWIAAFDGLAGDSLEHLVPAGLRDVLADLAARQDVTLTLVTGNLRPIAERKLAAAGLAGLFRPEFGGYGSDAEDRDELPPIARARRGAPGSPWPREDTVLVGDTPRDIACARADGLHCIAVTTGPYAADALAEADAVAESASQLASLLGARLDARRLLRSA